MPPIEMTQGTDNAGLSEQEQQFFATGDASVLNLSEEPGELSPPAQVQEDAAEAAEPKTAPEAHVPQISPAEIALENERQRRIELERRVEEMQKTPAKPDVPLPDPNTDPIGHMIERMRRMDEEAATLRQQLAEQQQKSELQRQWAEFANNVRAIKAEFTKTTPDFDAAYTHLSNIKIADMMDGGLSRAEAMKRLNQEEVQLAANALEKGKNPAEVIYNMAKRYGYAAQPAKDDNKAQQDAEQRVTRLANGQFANRATQRSAPPDRGNVTIEGLKDASDKDLNSIVTDDRQWKEIIGGKPGGDIFHH